MKDIYENPVLAEFREREKEADRNPYWAVDFVLPELSSLMGRREVVMEVVEGGLYIRPLDNGRVVYPVPETMPGPEALFSHIILSGGLDFGSEWWDIDNDGWIGVAENGDVQDNWEIRVTYGCEGDVFEGVLSPATLAQAIMRIASGAAHLKDEFVKECKLMAAGQVDDVDIDAWVGDGIMQVAITGDSALYG